MTLPSRRLAAALLTLGFGASALAQDAALPSPAAVARAVPISQAAFALAPVQFEGHPEVLTDEQRASLAQAMTDAFPAALARRYPLARVAPPEDASAVRVTPVVVVPASLSPFESAVLRLEVRLPQGETRRFEQRFSLVQLWLAQQDAGRVAWDGALAALPAQ